MSPPGRPPAAPLTRGRMTGRAPASAVRAAPGVAVAWLDPLFRELEGLRSDIAGFVGLAPRGPVAHALRLASASEFDEVYGPAVDGFFLAHAVHGFFDNGGDTCWVVRAVDRRTAAAATVAVGSDPVLHCVAHSPGRWGNGMSVEVLPSGRGRVTVTVVAPDGRSEQWRDLDGQGLLARFGVSPTSDRTSALVRMEFPEGTAVPRSAARGVFSGGDDGLTALTPGHLVGDDRIRPAGRNGAALLDDIDEITMIAVPDLVLSRGGSGFDPEGIADAQAYLAGDCHALRRTALLQHADPDALVDEVVRWREGLNSAFAALYWPWLRIADPARPSRLLAVPPTGHAAGVVARSDRSAGPHKPPAGEELTGALGITRRVDDEDHGRANSAGVNAIRPLAGRGLRLLGCRTTSNETQWRYLNVRRLVTHIERSIASYAAWVVFEPDGEGLREDLERVVRQYLDDLWRGGVLDGDTAEEAYAVVVEDARMAEAAGRLVVEIGVRPPWPAEYVMLRIDVTEIGSGGGARGGEDRGGDG
ncbi:phage tail sheath family protein [Streptomyces canus]|uniref:phage tail sheath family protein n=1 Tax=Streptomyces canus TaxID=58343 RepID=UPI0036B21A8F